MLIAASAFNLGAPSRILPGTLHMSLQLDTIMVPVQLNPRDYVQHLRRIIPEEDIIRWYIAKIEDGVAVIEVVRETGATIVNATK